jgi:Icc-related predicted phosphoesterase
MKLLAFVDLHGDAGCLKRLIKRAKNKDIDLVVTAGDLTMFEDHMRHILRKLNSIGKKVLIIPGNHESEKNLRDAVKSYENCVEFNKKAVKVGGYVFLGYGEGGFSLNDPEFRKVSRGWYGKYQKEKVILVLHGPPFGTRLDKIDGKYVGNKDFRKFIERIKPKMVICGHLHETAGKIDKIGKTKVINPGWEGAVVELS